MVFNKSAWGKDGSRRRQRLHARVALERIAVELDAEPWTRWNAEHAVLVELEARQHELFDIGHAGLKLDPSRDRHGGRQCKIGRYPHAGIPTVRHEQDATVVSSPCQAARFAQAATLGQVWLDDIDRAALDERLETLPARENFPRRDQHRRRSAQRGKA